MSTETSEPESPNEKPPGTTEIIPAQQTGIMSAARYGFDAAQVRAIKATVAKGCTDAELVMFLEVCGRYELDPFAKQIYAAKMNGENGGISIIVSRDGLLAHAHRQPDFGRMDGDVVYANDEFTMTFDSDTEERHIKHSYNHAGSEGRGAIVGAWAMVKRENHGTTYFYAPLSEYKRSSPIWSKHTSAMILKVAESYALRKAYSISGVVGEDEMDTSRATNLTSVDSSKPVSGLHPDWGDNAELATTLREAVLKARELWPEKWLPAKIDALLRGATDEQRAALLKEIQADLAGHAASQAATDAPATPDEAEQVVDAEVVPDEAVDVVEPVADEAPAPE